MQVQQPALGIRTKWPYIQKQTQAEHAEQPFGATSPSQTSVEGAAFLPKGRERSIDVLGAHVHSRLRAPASGRSQFCADNVVIARRLLMLPGWSEAFASRPFIGSPARTSRRASQDR